MAEYRCPLAHKEGTHDFCRFDKSVSCEKHDKYEECLVYHQALTFAHGAAHLAELETLVVGD
ncbi:MAG: hypothetical protein WCI72_00300 [archaeon]